MKDFLTVTLALVLICAGSAISKPSKRSEYRDSRDKQKYRLVKIADRVWFGDNLNFNAEGSFCLDDDENNCMAYGRLYTSGMPLVPISTPGISSRRIMAGRGVPTETTR